MPWASWSEGLGWGALVLSLGVAVTACDGSSANVGSTGVGDALADGTGGQATSSSAAGTAGAPIDGDVAPDEDCPESEPEGGEPCSVAEPEPFGSLGVRCAYNVECAGECCPYDEYTCEGGRWSHWYVHCDGPAQPDPVEPFGPREVPSDPSVDSDGGVAWCDFSVAGRPADPCYAWCERRAATGCPLDSTVELCRDACDTTLERAPELGERCVALRCALMACQATAEGDACDPLGFCQSERSDYAGTCTPTR